MINFNIFKKGIRTIICISVLFSSYAYSAPKRIVYTGNPLTIELSLNEEQRITFPDAKLIGGSVNEKLTNEGFLRVDIVNNEVYLTALKEFKKDRNIFLKEGSSDIFLIDLVGTKRKLKEQRIIVVKGEDRHAFTEAENKPAPEEVIAPLSRANKTPTAGYKTLIQFATREVYAPDRLRGGVKGIYREKINTKPVLNLLRHNKFITKPVASWRSGKLHVIAISVTNNTNEVISVSPLQLRGNWKAATFYRSRISPKGTPFDNTTLFLISDSNFEKAVEANPIIRIAGK